MEEYNIMNNNLRVSVPVSTKIKVQFYDIIKNSGLLIIKETKLSEDQIDITVQLNSCEDAYWLGRNHELIYQGMKNNTNQEGL